MESLKSWAIAILFAVVIFGATWIYGNRIYRMNADCEDRGGALVRGVLDFVCVESR